MRENVEALQKLYAEFGERLSDPAVLKDQQKYKILSREHARIQKNLRIGERYIALLEQMEEDRQILVTEKDSELIAMAREELETLEPEFARVQQELEDALLPHDPNDDRDAILEIRAGTGGDEAALFAEEICRMYLRFAERHGWRTEFIDATSGTAGGMKEVIYSVRGEGVYGIFRHESGVHRVQRVPVTESQGRIHTSAVTVAVLPEAEEVDIAIRPEELRIDVYRAQGPGGQSVNTTDSAVRITHLPTGLVVQCQDEKSQHKNKAKAMKVLRSRLLEAETERLNNERADARRSQVGSGERSEKIRTYNYPQNRVTDHRAGLTLHRLDQLMEGALGELLDGIQTHVAEQAEKVEQQRVGPSKDSKGEAA